MSKRKLSDDDLALWRRIVANVEPLKRVTTRVAAKPQAPLIASAKPKRARLKPDPAPAPATPMRASSPPPVVVISTPPSTPGIDRRTTSKLRRGHIAIEAKLDLHGMTQREAHDALNRFISASQERGKRCVLVVTGVGKAGGGVLRGAVPRWLAEAALRDAVMSFAPAEPNHGGQGALYVLLRKKR